VNVAYRPKLKSVPEIIAIEVFGGGANPQSWEEEAVGGQGWYYSKERWRFPIGPP